MKTDVIDRAYKLKLMEYYRQLEMAGGDSSLNKDELDDVLSLPHPEREEVLVSFFIRSAKFTEKEAA